MSQKPKPEPSAEDPAPQSSKVTLLKEEYETLLSRLKELEGIRERLLRSAADFDNAKKRLAREREEFVRFSQEGLIRELLAVLDNFERALNHAEEVRDPSAKRIVEGIQMVLKHLHEILRQQGLERLKTVGGKFDPHLHEAVAYVHEPGHEDVILEEIAPGYRLHDRLLRAAKVRVRVAPSKEMPEGQKDRTVQEEKQDEIT